MKEDMFEVLMYLFKHHMKNDCRIPLSEDLLMADLERAGFDETTIDKALDWLEGLLSSQENILSPIQKDIECSRYYSPFELFKLNTQVRGFLLTLEVKRILNSMTRELVIDRLMAIEDEEIDLAQVKWVTFLVLFNQPDEEAALACMEKLVLEHSVYGLH